MRELEGVFALTEKTRIVDVGGTERNWHLIDSSPRVTLVNISGGEYARGQFVSARGDGTALQFPDAAFDIAYSNSVIEHLGTLERQQAFAREIRRVGQRYYVQTPYKWFPIEPHFLCVGIHWLPKPIYRRLVRWLSVWGWVDRPGLGDVDEQLAEIRLLTVVEMRELFPDGELKRERVFGFTKSLIMTRRQPPRSFDPIRGDMVALFPTEWQRDRSGPSLQVAYHDVRFDEPALMAKAGFAQKTSPPVKTVSASPTPAAS